MSSSVIIGELHLSIIVAAKRLIGLSDLYQALASRNGKSGTVFSCVEVGI